MTRPIESDRFAESVEGILSRVSSGVREVMPGAIRAGIRTGAKAWRRNIRSNFKTGTEYRKHGRTYTVGAYSKSIRSHMVSRDSDHPAGEVGSPGMPWLPHLLEDGHAKVGGGRVRAIPHVADAADEAFEATERAVEDAIGGALDDA